MERGLWEWCQRAREARAEEGAGLAAAVRRAAGRVMEEREPKRMPSEGEETRSAAAPTVSEATMERPAAAASVTTTPQGS